jgi:hypothetical protein
MRIRRLSLESLEARYALTVDVNGDGWIAPLDALVIAHALDEQGEFATATSLDVNGDGFVTSADLDAVCAVLAGRRPSSTDNLAEGEEDLPLVAISGNGVVYEDGATSYGIYIARTTDDYSSPLTVYFTVSGAGDHSADSSDYVVPASYTFAAYEIGSMFSVSAVDDTKVEENEGFRVWIAASPTYEITQGSASATLEIKDDEWRFVAPDVPAGDPTLEWNPTDTVIEIDGWDGTLDPHGEATVAYHQIAFFHSWAFATYVNQHEAGTGGDQRLIFDCDSQTGDIWLDDFPTTLVGNEEWVSAAMRYSYQISDATGTGLHTVAITLQFAAGAGGTFTPDHTSGQNSGSGTYTPWVDVKEGARYVQSQEFNITLNCRRGPSP